jgi:hypothetical protein
MEVLDSSGYKYKGCGEVKFYKGSLVVMKVTDI